MLQEDKPDDFVISTGETYSVREFLEYVFELAGLDPAKHVEFDPRLIRPHEVPCLVGDSTKARQILGWKPKVKFKNLCKLMLEEDLDYFSTKVRIGL